MWHRFLGWHRNGRPFEAFESFAKDQHPVQKVRAELLPAHSQSIVRGTIRKSFDVCVLSPLTSFTFLIIRATVVGTTVRTVERPTVQQHASSVSAVRLLRGVKQLNYKAMWRKLPMCTKHQRRQQNPDRRFIITKEDPAGRFPYTFWLPKSQPCSIPSWSEIN